MDAVVIIVLTALTVGIVAYLVKQKKRGNVCPGCSCSGGCSGKCKK